jgi:hypothetical protein
MSSLLVSRIFNNINFKTNFYFYKQNYCIITSIKHNVNMLGFFNDIAKIIKCDVIKEFALLLFISVKFLGKI